MDESLILGRYRLLERIAVGGSAEVWRAHDDQLNRPVAVKRLHAHLLPDDASRRRLAAEARMVAQLSHPVIVDVYDVDIGSDAPAIVMELVDGESLARRIERDGPLAASDAAGIGADLADALYHAHGRGVIHRDVKPGNVLLGAGRTRLVDFGIARSLAESAERLTLTGTVVGTLHAMAPEQLAGGPVGPRTDLYGLGVVLHEALLGRPPYPARSPVALAEAQAAGPPAIDGLDEGLARIVEACLSPSPDDRPPHARWVADALRGWMSSGVGVAAPPVAMSTSRGADTSAVTRPSPALAAAAASPSPAAPGRGWRRIPVAVGAAALAAVAVLIVAFNAATPGASSPPPTQTAPSEVAATLPPATAAPAAPAVDVEAKWFTKLAEKYEKECESPLDPSVVAGMSERDAKRHVDGQIDDCKERRRDD